MAKKERCPEGGESPQAEGTEHAKAQRQEQGGDAALGTPSACTPRWMGQPGCDPPSCPPVCRDDYFGILKEARVTMSPVQRPGQPHVLGQHTAIYLGWAIVSSALVPHGAQGTGQGSFPGEFLTGGSREHPRTRSADFLLKRAGGSWAAGDGVAVGCEILEFLCHFHKSQNILLIFLNNYRYNGGTWPRTIGLPTQWQGGLLPAASLQDPRPTDWGSSGQQTHSPGAWHTCPPRHLLSVHFLIRISSIERFSL